MNRMQDSVYHHVGHCEDVRTMCCNNEPGARWPHNCHINVGWYLNLTASPWLPHLILVAGWASGWRAVCWLLNVCIPPGNVGGSQVSKPWRYYPFKISKNYPRPLPSLARVFSSHSHSNYVLCERTIGYSDDMLLTDKMRNWALKNTAQTLLSKLSAVGASWECCGHSLLFSPLRPFRPRLWP